MKIKILIFFSLMLLFTFSCKTKEIQTKVAEKEISYIPYYLKVYEADSLYIVGNYKKSYKILDSLFLKYEPVNMDLYYEYLTYIKASFKIKKKVRKHKIQNLVEKYGYTKDFFDYNPELKNEKSFAFFKNDKKYQELRGKYLSSVNLGLIDTIIKMKTQDQLYRNKDYLKNIKKQDSIDKKNTALLINTFNKYGFPDKTLIGNYSIDKGNIDINVILLHTKDSIRTNYFMPKILEYIKQGFADPELYATLYDQYLIYKGQEQFYGSYDSEMETSVKIVNQRRRSIGLPTYDYAEWRSRKLYPNFYSKQNN